VRPAGAINQVTKTPHAGDSQDYSLGYGSDDYNRVTADVNLGLSDSLALRVNAMYHDAEVSNRDVVENERWGTIEIALVDRWVRIVRAGRERAVVRGSAAVVCVVVPQCRP
jgi:outer membrane receptor for monomeric catechols